MDLTIFNSRLLKMLMIGKLVQVKAALTTV